MANGNGNGNVASKPGVVFGISNDVVAIIGTVALVGIGAHLLGEWMKPKRHYQMGPSCGAGGEKPALIEAMYGEIAASATHPEQVHANRDRVHAAIKQRVPRLQQLADRGPDKVADGIRGNAQDVMDQLGIPSQPHPSAASPELVRLFQNQRAADMSNRYTAPGQLILNPAETKYLEHQAMSYQVTTDPVQRHLKKEAEKDAREMQRLARLRQMHADRQADIQQRELSKTQEAQTRRAPSSSFQGSVWPIG